MSIYEHSSTAITNGTATLHNAVSFIQVHTNPDPFCSSPLTTYTLPSRLLLVDDDVYLSPGWISTYKQLYYTHHYSR